MGPASFLGSIFGLVSIDNNAVAWKSISHSDKIKGVVTYPVPKDQVTAQTNFNEIQNAEIRIVMFSNQTNHSIRFNIFDLSNINQLSKTGEMNFSRQLTNNHTLYTAPLSEYVTKESNYRIDFEGDFNHSLEFIIGQSFKTNSKKSTEYPRIIQMLTITYPIFFAFLFIITIPIPYDKCKLQSSLDIIENWVETGEGSKKWWFVVTFAGFIVVRARFQHAPLWIRIVVFLFLIYGIIGPLLFFQTEDLIGYVWIYGYYISNKPLPASFGLIYGYIYIGVVCFPMIILCSSFGVLKWSIKQVGDCVLACCCIVVDVILIIRIVHETAGSKFTPTSIAFVYIPLIFIVIIIIWLTVLKRKTDFNKSKNIDENNKDLSDLDNKDKEEQYNDDDLDNDNPIEIKPINLI